MAGKMCPRCGQYTFFSKPDGRVCTKCGYKMVVPPKEAPGGGKGRKCPNCNKFTVFNNKCRSCGAMFYL